MNNAIYLRRRSKILVPPAERGPLLPASYVGTFSKNLETLGYGLSELLVEELRTLHLVDLSTLYEYLVEEIKLLRGAHKPFRPMYPNFPHQVMEMSEADLYLNAIFHYWSDGRYIPPTETQKRPPLTEDVKLTMIDLGSTLEFESLFGRIAGSNASLSPQDKEDLAWFVESYGDDVERLMPPSIPQKENAAYIGALLLKHTSNAVETVGKLCKTATDVLRLAVAMSEGDVSLATPVKFKSFTRRERRMLLSILESVGNPTEDMLRWKERWKRLGERLHPGEEPGRYPKATQAFQVLRRDLSFETFNSGIEKALAKDDIDTALDELAGRPGDLARRLDHLLRKDLSKEDAVIAAFGKAASKVSTPVLLQVMTHFKHRSEPAELRVFFPKGEVAKAQAIDYNLPPLPDDVNRRVYETCVDTLTKRFAALPPLGKVYVDPLLASYLIPFSQRSASKSLRTIVRGSRVRLPDADTLRFLIWWKDGNDRTDLDLSAVMFDENFDYKTAITYYNLKEFGGFHSGDIVSAPEGASEFIDVSLEKLAGKGVGYVVMMVNSFTRQPYRDLPECFAGWMARKRPQSGEIFEARTVQDRFDLTADSGQAIPVVFDLKRREAVWCDLSLKSHPNWANNVENNRKGIRIGLMAICSLRKTTLYDLLALHAGARGVLTSSQTDADVVFSVDAGTPYELDTIASQFMV